MGLGALILYLLNRHTPVPAAWGSTGGARNNPWDVANVILQALIFSGVSGAFGALVINRLPTHLIGWLLCVVGLASAASMFLGEWTVYGAYTAPGALPAVGLAAWITNWMWIALFGALQWMLAVFPDGRALSRRWLALTWIPTAIFVASMFLGAIIETPMSSAYKVANPFVRQHPAALYDFLFGIGGMAMAAAIVAVLASAIARFRHSRGRQRQQMKWMMSGVTLMAALALTGLLLSLVFNIRAGDFLVNASFLGALLGIGVAMLRHRLYDIDVIIRRTLIYSVLTGLLALVYFGSVVILQSVVTAVSGRPSSLTIVISTLAIAVLFSPLRRRVQEVIDRRFFRSKYDAEQALQQFAETAQGETELDRLGEELLNVVDETVQPEHAWLWLRSEGGEEELVMANGNRLAAQDRAS